MDKPTDAPTLNLELSENELISVEYDLPRLDVPLDERAASERERYDDQILAALVAPSF